MLNWETLETACKACTKMRAVSDAAQRRFRCRPARRGGLCEHGQWEQKGGIWFTALYHPSALLRDETKWPETFRDLKSLQAKVREVCTHTL